MSCNRFIEWSLDRRPGGELPADLRSHVDACPDCRRDLAVSRLLAGCRIPEPDADFESRIAAGVRDAIASGRETAGPADRENPFIAWLSRVQTARIAAAAALLLLALFPLRQLWQPAQVAGPDGSASTPAVAVQNVPAPAPAPMIVPPPGAPAVASAADSESGPIPVVVVRDRIASSPFAADATGGRSGGIEAVSLGHGGTGHAFNPHPGMGVDISTNAAGQPILVPRPLRFIELP